MDIDSWQSLGSRVGIGDDSVFLIDAPATDREDGPPVLVIHGFPTSSIDWAPVLGELRRHRRVVLPDLPGFGLSDKPDRPYSIAGAADAVEGVLSHLHLAELDLVTHDMGDTVGGELLARDLEGGLRVQGSPVRIRRRVVTNGSIYLSMAHLTDGQQALWSAPDERLPAEAAPSAEMLQVALTATLAPSGSPGSNPDTADLRAAAEAVCHAEGSRLLPRLIRYLDDRRRDEERYTGAIETHPSPLGIIWGTEDPIAVIDMARRLHDRRGDSELVELEGVGHYPMIEAPTAFASSLLGLLADGRP